MSRTDKSLKNITFGLSAQLITTLMTFISRTIMLKFLGLEIVSLNSLFHEVITTLSLAELGMGSAIVYNLYKPLAENNIEKVSQLMTFFKQAYRVIAGAIFVLGAIACFFAPKMVNGIDFPNGYLYLVFMLFVINISFSYLYSYKISLLNADQNNYIYSIYSSIYKVIGSVLLVGIMVVTKDFIIYLITNIIVTLITNILISHKIDMKYNYLKKIPLPKEDKKNIYNNVKNIFIKELSGKITSSTDNILISTIISTIVVGKYSFYSTILAVLKQFTERIEVSLRSSMGNLYASGKNTECMNVLHRLTWGYCTMGIVFCTCFYSGCQSFISFWVGTDYLLEKPVIFILTINLFCYVCSKPIYSAMHVSGFFVEGRNISIIGSVVNLITSIIFAYLIGISGIFLGTFLTYFIQIVAKVYYVYKLKFECSSRDYVWLLIKFSVVLLALVFGCDYISTFINTSINLLDFMLKSLISGVISFFVLILLFRKDREFLYFKSLALCFIYKIKNKKVLE